MHIIYGNFLKEFIEKYVFVHLKSEFEKVERLDFIGIN